MNEEYQNNEYQRSAFVNNEMSQQSTTGQEESLTHMQLSNEAEAEASKKKASKKAKKGGSGLGKSMLNGIAFGLCAALVFCGVVAVGNRTFLKPAMPKSVEENRAADEVAMDGEKAEQEVALEQTEVLPEKPAPGAQQTGMVPSNNSSISAIAQNVMPSVVSITITSVEEVRSMFGGTREYESSGAGSGIIVGQNDTELLVATNNHVVSGANTVSVCFNDSEDAVVAATVKGTDSKNDLAVVAVNLADIDKDVLAGIKVATIGDSNALSVGDQVVAIGNALGYGRSVTTGIVSALNREVDIEDMAASLIQTDAAINPGNSGGALVNMKGELIGINSAKFASSYVEGMGYAIPIATAEPILSELMNRQTRELAKDDEAGFLGVSVQDVSQEASQFYGIPEGAYIAECEKGGAAQKAGLQKGDIITKFDGIEIRSSADLKKNIAYYKKGEVVEVTYMRSNDGNYTEAKVSVVLATSDAVTAQKQEQNAANGENKNDSNWDPKDGLTPPKDSDKTDKGNDEKQEPEDNQQYDQGNGYGGSMEEFFNRFFGSEFFGGYGDGYGSDAPSESSPNDKGI